MRDTKKHKTRRSESGQAMVEFALMLFLLGPILMCAVVVYDVIDEMVTVQEDLRYELRSAIDEAAPGLFHRIEKNETARVEVPGKMNDWFFGQDSFSVDMSLIGYGGCYHGVMQSEYRLYKKFRTIRVTQ